MGTWWFFDPSIDNPIAFLKGLRTNRCERLNITDLYLAPLLKLSEVSFDPVSSALSICPYPYW